MMPLEIAHRHRNEGFARLRGVTGIAEDTGMPTTSVRSSPGSSPTRAAADDGVFAQRDDIAQYWFSALDHRRFGVGQNRWTAVVAGIHVLGRDVWIQVQSARNKHRSCTVHITSETSLQDALGELERMIERTETTEIIAV